MSGGMEATKDYHHFPNKCQHGWYYCKECGPEENGKAPTRPLVPRVVDNVNHPPHYKSHPSGIECIEITRHFNFNRGNAIAYIWRAGEKENEIEDLKKAVWHLNDEIARLEKEKVK